VRNVFVENCFFDSTGSGFRIKSTKSRGGFIENIWLNNIRMNQIQEEAIVFNMQYTSALKNKKASRNPLLKNIHINNVNGSSLGRAIDIIGLKDGIMKDIFFENINLMEGKKSELKYAKNLELNNIVLKIKNGPALAVENGQNIIMDNFSCENDGGICLEIKGENNSNVDIKKSGLDDKKIFIEEMAKREVKM